ncbi:MAG: sortase [Lachnospiraceae bacterium]|nr:sortase [Lachnospiraceae bacterium]
MRKWIGTICIILGIACLLGAVGFMAYNRWEAESASEKTQSLLKEVQTAIDENKTDDPIQNVQEESPLEEVSAPAEMATVTVDGYDCIGILSIPVLELELPVLADWSYEKLKKAPCHYYGTYGEKDFVIAAHNYEAHFGRLSKLQAGDIVVFTDTRNVVHIYEVVLLETLPEEATEAMITSGFDLSLYTCTTGGANRITVRCNIKKTDV